MDGGLSMAEYIEREAFKKSVEERYCKPCKADGKDHNGCWCRACWVDDMLDEVECFQHSDVVPVVRCKDCKYYRCDITDEFSSCYLGSLSGPDGNDFCCYGERKE